MVNDTVESIVNFIFGKPQSSKQRQSESTKINHRKVTKENENRKHKPSNDNNSNNDDEATIEGPLMASPIPPNYRVLEKYALAPPFSYAIIAEDPNQKLPYYFIDEVQLNEQERLLYDKIITTLQIEVKAPREATDPRKYFAEEAQRTVNRYRLMRKWRGDISWAVLLYYAERDMVGFGALDPLMRDPNIEDISLDSATRPVFVYHRNHESLESNLVFKDEQKLDDMIVRLVHMSGKHVSSAFPIVDATLPGKHRLAATFRKEVTPQGSSMTIRKFREDPITVIDLINFKTIDYTAAAYAWLLIENRAAAVVVGATASGKTTFLNALLSMVNPNSKIVTIEEVQEINIHHINWEPLVSRLSYGLTEETAGEISLFQLVKAAMRMRPDILVVGEVRGEEAYALFQAISTGHGGLATLHADNAPAAIQRLTSKPMDVAPSYITFLDLVFSVRRVAVPNVLNPDKPRMVRRLISIDEVLNAERMVPVFSWEARTDTYQNELSNSGKLRALARDRGRSMDDIMKELGNRIRVLQWLVSKQMRNFIEVSTIFSQYHADPKGVLARIEREERARFQTAAEAQLQGLAARAGGSGTTYTQLSEG